MQSKDLMMETSVESDGDDVGVASPGSRRECETLRGAYFGVERCRSHERGCVQAEQQLVAMWIEAQLEVEMMLTVRLNE